ncbi:hypothetical protein [Ralstonia solanacearum]|uniref:Uncharacterized protein n=1 Tax=Ralstonia solanacearum TaxID=305 RepID=A0AAE3NLH4_RALSL|nr:hypothetical protein [Ralstonia solanacearum]MBB6582217.1 hypothetical protein [Ralstonia solanacearum]MDB0522696.1 hypothetical protein [Ralstonia solanacearum]
MAQLTSLSSIPHDVRLLAAVSRLIDLHQSRRDTGVYVPETPERAGYMLAVAFLLLEILRELEMDRGPTFAAVGEVHARIRQRVRMVTAEDLNFVVESLARERDVRFGVEDGKGGLEFGLTKESTPLIELARDFKQIQLTENGRLLLRVSADKANWLYTDIDAERLVAAIERRQFGDIPRLCRSLILEVASKSKQLSSAMERPTLSELRDLLLAEGSGIAQALQSAIEVVKRANALIHAANTADAFRIWKLSQGVEYSLGNLQTEIEMVMQNVEALSRRFVSFLDTAQRAKPVGGTGVDFLAIVKSLTTDGASLAPQRLEALVAGVMPWGMRSTRFHSSDLVAAVDFTEIGKDCVVPISTFTVDPSQGNGNHNRFLNFLLRNRARVLGRLRAQPALFSEILSDTEFALEPGESPADFLGVYSSPEQLEGDGFRIRVGLTGKHFNTDIEGTWFSGTDPMMFLEEENL